MSSNIYLPFTAFIGGKIKKLIVRCSWDIFPLFDYIPNWALTVLICGRRATVFRLEGTGCMQLLNLSWKSAFLRTHWWPSRVYISCLFKCQNSTTTHRERERLSFLLIFPQSNNLSLFIHFYAIFQTQHQRPFHSQQVTLRYMHSLFWQSIFRQPHQNCSPSPNSVVFRPGGVTEVAALCP